MTASRTFRRSTLSLAVVLCAGLAPTFSGFAQSGPKDAKRTDTVVPDETRDQARLCAKDASRGGCDEFMRGVGLKPVIGVLLAPDAQGGVRISGLTPEGPSAKAGLKSGDRIVAVDGKRIAGDTPEARVEHARELLRGLDTSRDVRLTYARDGRESELSLRPQYDTRVVVVTRSGQMLRPGAGMTMHRIEGGDDDVRIEKIVTGGPLGGPHAGTSGDTRVFVFSNDDKTGADAPGKRERHVIRIECKGDDAKCKEHAHTGLMQGAMPGLDGHAFVFRSDCEPGKDCRTPLLAEAFRWNGLNLASVDAQLGRYFGTTEGVLVLSAGDLAPLQAGDVVRKVDGTAVTSPRQLMDALRTREAGSEVPVEFLRDRKTENGRIVIPKTMSLPKIPPLAMLPSIEGDMPEGMPRIHMERRIVTDGVHDGDAAEDIEVDVQVERTPSDVD